jgi:hypothetical protein
MKPRTCVTPEGKFRYGIHKPHFKTPNLRQNDFCQVLGLDEADAPIDNGSLKYQTLFLSEVRRTLIKAGQTPGLPTRWKYICQKQFPLQCPIIYLKSCVVVKGVPMIF